MLETHGAFCRILQGVHWELGKDESHSAYQTEPQDRASNNVTVCSWLGGGLAGDSNWRRSGAEVNSECKAR